MKKLIFAFTCLFLAVTCRARIITVDWYGSGDYLTIQAAIDDSNDGDIIIVRNGTYTGDCNRDIDFLGKAITVRSENGPEYCIIDCNGTGSDQHRGFFLHSGEDANSAIIGFTITNGFALFEYLPPFFEKLSEGGAILLENSSPTISNCIITGNSTLANYAYGGGICIRGGGPTITNCILSRNWAYLDGGGLYSMEGNPTITNCTFSGNQAQFGGGIRCEHGSITVTNCILWGNRDNRGEDAYSQFSAVHPTTVFINYYCIQGVPGTLNPLFADSNNDDYHLQSQAGRWEPNSQNWVQDDVTSPCIDTGDPNSDWTAELWPHGKRINMGAYGGTPQASMSPLTDFGYIADLNNDDKVDFGDLKLFTKEWQNEQPLLSEDLDRDGFVNFDDLAIFGLQWSYPSALEPGITYQVEKCDPNSYRSPAAEPAIETRFSVTVEGLYIHFKDMMVANCCTDKLGLEMTVEDNLVTIYEIEYIPGVCFCICDYPVTATLGPFEPDAYVLEVYEDWGGFIGSTSVVINPPQ